MTTSPSCLGIHGGVRRGQSLEKMFALAFEKRFQCETERHRVIRFLAMGLELERAVAPAVKVFGAPCSGIGRLTSENVSASDCVGLMLGAYKKDGSSFTPQDDSIEISRAQLG
jgi:hypothetical protein